MMVDECSCFFTVYIFILHDSSVYKKSIDSIFSNKFYVFTHCMHFFYAFRPLCELFSIFFFGCISMLICLYSRRMLEFNLFKQHIWILADDGSCIHSVRYMLDKCFKSLDYARVLDILCTIFRVSSSLLV